MSRRSRNQASRFEDGSRQSIGDQYVNAACNALDRACSKEAHMFVRDFNARDVVAMLFRDEDVAKLTAVHGLLATENRNETYELPPYGAHIAIRTDWMPAPCKNALSLNNNRVGPLLEAIRTLQQLHRKWGAVKYLLRWFNRNATPGAVRANWPSVLTLCPDAPMLKELQHAPTRYTNPQELSSLLPLIRDTATTVASMQLMSSEAQPRPATNGVWITLCMQTVNYAETEIFLDSQTFYL